ncbi:hypothetical protein CDD83_9180 [Cordyceps sp. RAO-2017]|nr:hypothetical protein CDD83_9180 [Cordyceps sp. RAO-2017]
MAADAAPSPKNILRGHRAQVHVAAFVRGNERLATADADGYVVLWDLAVMRPAAVWRAHDKSILGVEGWGRDRIITHGRDHRLIVWKLAARDEQDLSSVLPLEHVPEPRRQPWILHLLEVNTLNFCSFAACARYGGGPGLQGPEAEPDLLLAVPNTLVSEAIDIYALPGQSRLYTVNSSAKNGLVMCLRLFHHAGSLTLLAGFENGCASVHRLDAVGAWITTYRSQPHSQPVLSMDVHPSRDYFFTSSADSIIAQHPVPVAQQSFSLDASRSGPSVAEAESSPSSSAKSLLSDALGTGASHEKRQSAQKQEVWKHPLKTINTKHSGQQSLRVRSDGKIFATAGWDSKIRVYSCKTMKELAVLHWHTVGAYAVAFAAVDPDTDRREESSSADQMALHSSVGLSSPDTGRALVCSGESSGAIGLSVKDRRILRTTTTHWLAAGAKDGKVSLWDIY